MPNKFASLGWFQKAIHNGKEPKKHRQNIDIYTVKMTKVSYSSFLILFKRSWSSSGEI